MVVVVVVVNGMGMLSTWCACIAAIVQCSLNHG